MPKKILLADDEEDVKVVLKMFLENRGYSVSTAFDGLDTIDKARKEKPDLILLDIMMPVIDGFEVCRGLHGNSVLCSGRVGAAPNGLRGWANRATNNNTKVFLAAAGAEPQLPGFLAAASRLPVIAVPLPGGEGERRWISQKTSP